MALIHPRSLERWQEWQRSRRRLSGIRQSLSSGPSERGLVTLTRRGEGPTHVVLGIDAVQGAVHGGLPAVLPYLQGSATVVAPAGLDLFPVTGPGWARQSLHELADGLDGLGATGLVTLGGHSDLGAQLHAWARSAGVPSAVLQHDLLTPYSPPLPSGSTLLAWSAQDGAMHRAEREDVDVRVVGSQRLWQAAREAGDGVAALEERPVFHGQIASLELSRRLTIGAALSGCRSLGATYRPGPGETDALSRAAHVFLRRRGVVMQVPETTNKPMSRPVLAVLLADVLDAAARGTPAWVHAPSAPQWVREVWERYGMRPTGGDPTPPPPVAADEPARLIAQMLEGVA